MSLNNPLNHYLPTKPLPEHLRAFTSRLLKFYTHSFTGDYLCSAVEWMPYLWFWRKRQMRQFIEQALRFDGTLLIYVIRAKEDSECRMYPLRLYSAQERRQLRIDWLNQLLKE